MKHAFSLVELSIVLVILGLLTGGILAGQSLIRGAELRSVTTEAHRYATAIQTFRDKYMALPGDMTMATKFWGTAAGTGTDAACRNFKSTTPATCNGNGDGIIWTASQIQEQHRAWQHMANAGLIEGSYTGTTNASTMDENSPRMRAGGRHWGIYSWGVLAASVEVYAADYGNALSTHEYDVIRPDEAWSIDTKTDDGIPNIGLFMVGKADATYPCTTNAGVVSDANAQYNLTNTSMVCYPIFVKAFN